MAAKPKAGAKPAAKSSAGASKPGAASRTAKISTDKAKGGKKK